MTETIPKPAKDLAERVRQSRGHTGDMAELSAQAQRLRKALEVAQAWERAAGSSSEMFAHASYTADKLEEELARVSWEMDVVSDRSRYERARTHFGHEVPQDGEAHARELRESLISNALLDAYCTLSAAPLEVFGGGERVAEERTRYTMMGALLAAMEALEAQDVQGER